MRISSELLDIRVGFNVNRDSISALNINRFTGLQYGSQ